jgi:hypothetical protein
MKAERTDPNIKMDMPATPLVLLACALLPVLDAAFE